MFSEFASRSVRTLAKTADRLRPPDDGIVILLYHRVGAGTASRVDISIESFRSQMAELAASGRCVSLGDALEILAGRIAAPHPKPVVVTFDDGTSDFVENAVPILGELGVPATLYVATRWVEEGMAFWEDDSAALSWAALREALSTGAISIGSHTHDHCLFDRISAHEANEQVRRSRGLISDHLAVEAVDFAYPKALAPTQANRLVVESYFRSATLAGTHPNPIGKSDPFALARSPITTDDEGTDFSAKLNGGLGLEDRFRSAFDRIRYRGRSW